MRKLLLLSLFLMSGCAVYYPTDNVVVTPTVTTAPVVYSAPAPVTYYTPPPIYTTTPVWIQPRPIWYPNRYRMWGYY